MWRDTSMHAVTSSCEYPAHPIDTLQRTGNVGAMRVIYLKLRLVRIPPGSGTLGGTRCRLSQRVRAARGAPVRRGAVGRRLPRGNCHPHGGLHQTGKAHRGLPEARWQLLAAAGVLLAVAAIWPLRRLTRELSTPVGENAPRASWPERLLFGLALLLLVAAFRVLGQFDTCFGDCTDLAIPRRGVNAAISAFTPPADRKK
jgi:hypothetical protein